MIYDLLPKLLRPRDPYIIEIGIHRGEDTEKFFQLFPHTTYVGFEPDPRNILFLKNDPKSPFSTIKNKNWSILECALSNVDGKRPLYLSTTDDGWCGSSSLNKPKMHLQHFPHVRFPEQVDVDVRTLGGALPIIPPIIDFIWMDAQGSELNIIKGGKEVLNNTRYLYTEYYNDEIYEGQPDIDDIAKELGDEWEIHTRWNNDVLFQHNTRISP